MTKERRSPIWETEGILYLSYRVHTGLGSCQPSLNSLHSPLKGDWRSFLSVALIQPWPKATSGRRGWLSYMSVPQTVSKGTQGRKSRQAPENRPTLLFTQRQVCRTGVWSRCVGVHVNLHMETCTWSLSCTMHLGFWDKFLSGLELTT